MLFCACDSPHPPTHRHITQHFTACNIHFSECRHCTVCLLRTFPSHYSICKQHVIPAVHHLHVVFSCFLIFCDDFTHWKYCWESSIIFYGPQPSSSLQSSITCTWAVVHLPKQYMLFEDCGQLVSSCWKSTPLFIFLVHLRSSTSDAEPGKAYRWRVAPVPCIC